MNGVGDVDGGGRLGRFAGAVGRLAGVVFSGEIDGGDSELCMRRVTLFGRACCHLESSSTVLQHIDSSVGRSVGRICFLFFSLILSVGSVFFGFWRGSSAAGSRRRRADFCAVPTGRMRGIDRKA